ncbi:MAG: DTW domain-containing protein [Deltaproteobacteria bacterium]|nr:DTW domain-containing protein [Deltaproteobacteria bacterium]
MPTDGERAVRRTDDDQASSPREVCWRCRRPRSYCWCAELPRLQTRTRVVFVQHPRERTVAIGTARMAHLALEGSQLVEGLALDEHAALQHLFAHDAHVAVLYPDGARPLDQWLPAPPRTLVVVDGTWAQAKKVLKLNPRLGALPRLGFLPTSPGNYRIRREPSDQHLATIEAVAAVLGALEGDAARFSALLQPFEWMVERQLEAARDQQRARFARPRVGKRGPTPPRASHTRGLSELVALDAARAVLVYGEANAHPRGERSPGAPELLHLVALRPSTGASFQAVLRPRRGLPEDVPARLGLPREQLERGEEPAIALARFRDFLGPAFTQVSWGGYARDLLAQEGEPKRGFVDLRALAARALGGCAGGVLGAARDLGAVVDVEGPRALRMLTLLEGIYRALRLRLDGAEHVGKT